MTGFNKKRSLALFPTRSFSFSLVIFVLCWILFSLVFRFSPPLNRYCCPWPWQKVCDFNNFDPHISAIEVCRRKILIQIHNHSELSRRKMSISLRIIHWISTSSSCCLERTALQREHLLKIVTEVTKRKTQITLMKAKIYQVKIILEILITWILFLPIQRTKGCQ